MKIVLVVNECDPNMGFLMENTDLGNILIVFFLWNLGFHFQKRPHFHFNAKVL